MSEIKLLPCPFCGGEKIVETYVAFIPSLQCKDCRATIILPANFYGNYKIELARKWNTRKPMERIIEKLKNLRTKPTETVYDTVLIGSVIEIVKEVGGIE